MYYSPESMGIKTTRYLGDGNYFCFCPFHLNPSGTSAIFNGQYGGLYCFSCNKYYSKKEVCLKNNIKEHYITRTFIAEKHEKDYDNYYNELMLSPLALGSYYLQSREILDDTIKHFGILENEEYIIFPVSPNYKRRLILRSTNNKIPKYIKIGKMPALIHNGINDGVPIIVENFFALLRGYQYGFNVWLTPTTSFKKEISFIIDGFDKIYFMFNDDQAGYHAAERLEKIHPNAINLGFCSPDEMPKESWEYLLNNAKT